MLAAAIHQGCDALVTFEGWQFRMEIRDRSEEV